MSSNRTWGFRHLLLGWAGYWTALAVTTLVVPVRELIRLSQQPDGTSNASFNFANDVLNVSMTSYGKTVWAGSETIVGLLLWITGPPLLIWLVWVWSRSRPAELDGVGAGATVPTARSASLPQPGVPFPMDVDAAKRDAVHAPRVDGSRS